MQHFFDGSALDKDALNGMVDEIVGVEIGEPSIVFVNRVSRKIGKTAAGQKLKVVSEVVPIAGAASGKYGDRQAITITFPEPFGTTSPAVVAMPYGRSVFMMVLTALSPTGFTLAVAQDPGVLSANVNISAISYVAVGFA